MKQRLLVAFALMGRPNVLLMDEPTAGVDEPGRRFLTSLIHRLQKEEHLTVLEISHDLAEVCRCATTVLCLGHNNHIHIGSPNEILTTELLDKLFESHIELHAG